jgi:superfamily I DNA/RNA helicase
MAKEKWLIAAGLLDDFQREILQKDVKDHLVVSGVAGSGKTLIALHRIRQIQDLSEEDEDVRFFFLVYTHALKKFIRHGVKNLNIKVDKVQLYSEWNRNDFGADYMVVDEVQDFNNARLSHIEHRTRLGIAAFGDDDQRVYRKSAGAEEANLSVEEVAEKLNTKLISLKKNYRTPIPIARFAAFFSSTPDFASTCEKNQILIPVIKHCDSPKDEIKWIADTIKKQRLEDVAILVPFADGNGWKHTDFSYRNAEFVNGILISEGLTPELSKTIKQPNGRENVRCEFNFETSNPKIITYSNSKGLQFETVFMPFIDFPEYELFHSKFKTSIFVALTRSMKNLFMTRTDKLCNTFAKIPQDLYVTI